MSWARPFKLLNAAKCVLGAGRLLGHQAGSEECAVGSKKHGVGGTTGLSGLLLAIFAVAAAPAATAAPAQPGDGDAFFIPEIQTVFKPPPSESAIREIIPLAHQVCDARASGQDDLQAAHLVWVGKGVSTLGIARGSTLGLEEAALQIVDTATLAYCRQYNNGNW